MLDYLSNDVEKTPEWLENFKIRKLTKSLLLSSRIVYYPGALFDMSTLRLMLETKSAHVIIYSDYDVKEETVIKRMIDECSCANYSLIYDQKLDIGKNDLDALLKDKSNRCSDFDNNSEIFAHAFILQNSLDLKDRYAFVYLGMDGIYAYKLLFNKKNNIPYILVIQDHGFGGNYDRFGYDSRLNKFADELNAYPKYIICETGERRNACWNGYHQVSNTKPYSGGMWQNYRYLHIKDDK